MVEAVIRVAPMTRAQKFQWFLEKGILTTAWELPCGTSERAAADLVSELGARFETLRTTFDVVDGRIQQIVQRASPSLRLVDLDGSGASATVSRLVKAFDAASHAVLGAPTTAFFLLRREGRPAWLVLIANHTSARNGDLRHHR